MVPMLQLAIKRSDAKTKVGRRKDEEEIEGDFGLIRLSTFALRFSNWMIKLQRATGGCLGARSRRRARRTAKCPGEQRACFDPGIPECGNAPTVMGGDPE